MGKWIPLLAGLALLLGVGMGFDSLAAQPAVVVAQLGAETGSTVAPVSSEEAWMGGAQWLSLLAALALAVWSLRRRMD